MQTTSDNADNTANTWDENDLIFIKGVTRNGNTFRPSDWCDRLYSTLQALSPDECLTCAQYVHLVNLEGRKGVLIDSALKDINAQFFKFFVNFVDSNDLLVVPISREEWNKLSQ